MTTNRSLVVMLVVLASSWFFGLFLVSFILPSSWYTFPLVSLLVGIVWISVWMGFMVYRTILRDERAIQVSDRSARNGFAFVLYGIPIAIVVLPATNVSSDTLLALAAIWIGAVVFAGISAFYYYHR
jgi:uncharacterized membrane protein